MEQVISTYIFTAMCTYKKRPSFGLSYSLCQITLYDKGN